MVFKWDLVYKTESGYVFQLNVVTMREIEFDVDRVYSFLYNKFNFFNNLKNKNVIGYTERFDIYYTFLHQGWHLVVAYDYLFACIDVCEHLVEIKYNITKEEYRFFYELKVLVEDLLEDKIKVVPIFTTVGISHNNKYVKDNKNLYVEFFNLINLSILEFNSNYYLEDLECEDIKLDDSDLIKYNIIRKFNFSNNVTSILVSKLLFD